jgi:hypothetical protein
MEVEMHRIGLSFPNKQDKSLEPEIKFTVLYPV